MYTGASHDSFLHVYQEIGGGLAAVVVMLVLMMVAVTGMISVGLEVMMSDGSVVVIN